MILHIILWSLAIILVVAGMAGLFFPVLPGAPLLYAGLFAAAWAEKFAYAGAKTLIVLGIMAALMYVLDFLAGAFGAKHFGASRLAVIGATLGAIIGIFFGIPGILLGPFIGAVLGEFFNRPNLRAAGMAGIGATAGLVLGIAAKLSLAFAMLGIFVFVHVL
ncbi:MAG: DUF456 domain-containing protein [Desulfobacterales bacterium]